MTPVYEYQADSFIVHLYSGSMKVSHEQFEASGDGDIFLELLPSPRVSYRMKVSEFTRLDSMPSWGGVTLSSPVRSCRAYMEKVDLEGSVLLRGSLEDTGLRVEGPLQRLVFHLLSFPTNLADSPEHHQTGAAPGVITLEAGEWRVSLETLARDSDLRFRLTHLGELARLDGGTFKLDDAWDVLSAVDTFLSFILGQRSHTCLHAGFDAAGVRSDGWDAPTPGSQLEALDAALLTRGAESLSPLWEGFYKLWSSEVWQKALLDAVGWYVEANSRVWADSALVLGQAALELLAWMKVVEEDRAAAPESFDKLRASERLRELLKVIGVAAGIPPKLTQLAVWASNSRWPDGPRIVTEMRNGVVHPRKPGDASNTSGLPLWEGRELMMWYLELVLLRLFGHRGGYRNRLSYNWEPVPWALGHSEAVGTH